MRHPLKIGTRRSRLALWQADHVKALIEDRLKVPCTLVRITTLGDRVLDTPLARIGGKGLFVKEIEEALLRGEIDLAVHSLKDVPAEIPAGLMLSAVPPREDPRDALLSAEPGLGLDALPRGACVGTSSLRRACQVRFYRRDLIIRPLRGNVETRIRKLQEGGFDAVLLAMAGLKRLALSHLVQEILSPDICLPAVGQGALGLEIRAADARLHEALQCLHDPATAAAVAGERGFLAAVGGGCQVPIGCHGEVSGPVLRLTGVIASLDGSACVRKSSAGPVAQAAPLGRSLAEEILAAGGGRILAEIEKTAGAAAGAADTRGRV